MRSFIKELLVLMSACFLSISVFAQIDGEEPPPPQPLPTVNGQGTAGYLAKFVSSGIISDSKFFESSDGIGIGTQDPNSLFAIESNVVGKPLFRITGANWESERYGVFTVVPKTIGTKTDYNISIGYNYMAWIFPESAITSSKLYASGPITTYYQYHDDSEIDFLKISHNTISTSEDTEYIYFKKQLEDQGATVGYQKIKCGGIEVVPPDPTRDWPDYVFNKNYQKMPLHELERFIEKNNHLPEVPNKTQVKDGVELLEMNQILLKKVEELTLYILDINEELEQLKQKVN